VSKLKNSLGNGNCESDTTTASNFLKPSLLNYTATTYMACCLLHFFFWSNRNHTWTSKHILQCYNIWKQSRWYIFQCSPGWHWLHHWFFTMRLLTYNAKLNCWWWDQTCHVELEERTYISQQYRSFSKCARRK
jgi:hypothetical protein